MTRPPAAIVDIDGTLVDSNYHHALAWYRAFRGVGIVLEVWRLHRLNGMGADQLVERIAGGRVESEHGGEIRARKDDLFARMRDEIAPIDGALVLLHALRDGGRRIVLATSATPDEAEHYIDLLGAREAIDGWTSAADVDATKPEPDLVEEAVARAGGPPAVMIGDSVWDCEAAARAGLPTVALLTGGFGRDELIAAGARAVHESPRVLAGLLGRPPLA